MSFIYRLHFEIGSFRECSYYKNKKAFFDKGHPLQRINIEKDNFAQKTSLCIDSVNNSTVVSKERNLLFAN